MRENQERDMQKEKNWTMNMEAQNQQWPWERKKKKKKKEKQAYKREKQSAEQWQKARETALVICSMCLFAHLTAGEMKFPATGDRMSTFSIYSTAEC